MRKYELTKEQIFSKSEKHTDEFLRILDTKKNSRSEKIIIFAGAGISIDSNLPSADTLLDWTLGKLLGSREENEPNIINVEKLRNKIQDETTQLSRERKLPPELIYDAIYEFAGQKVFTLLDPLRFGSPNLNHGLLAVLLKTKYVDTVVTTNFDCLIEKAVDSFDFFSSYIVKKNIWKIHGSIDDPNSMVTTFRRVGRMLFDEKKIDKLIDMLNDGHVLFIGYGGTDPDLNPAFRKAKAKKIFWNFLNIEEFRRKIQLEPWNQMKQNSGEIKWIIGDLRENIVQKIRISNHQIDRLMSQIADPKKTKESHGIKLQEELPQFTLSERARALAQIIYNGANISSSRLLWDLLVEYTTEILRIQDFLYENDFRDIYSFRAEAFLKIGDVVRAKNDLTKCIPIRVRDAIQAQVLLNTGAILNQIPGDHNLAGAEQATSEALNIANSLPNNHPSKKSLQGRGYSNLCAIRARQNRSKDVLKYFDIAEDLFISGGDLYGFLGCCINKARFLIDIGHLDDAKKYYQKAKDILFAFGIDPMKRELKDLEDELLNLGCDINK